MKLKPFFPYLGSKYRMASRYPEPTYDVIVEPFAGSACYSLHYPSRQVILSDASEHIVNVWEYLISVAESDIIELPDVNTGDHVDDFDIPRGAKDLIGFWMFCGAKPTRSTNRSKDSLDKARDKTNYWGDRAKARIVKQIPYIRHWTCHLSEYQGLDVKGPATWFVDPPYQDSGKAYDWVGIDYRHLGQWCKSRDGQVIVCESGDADWLPFNRVGHTKTAARSKQGNQKIVELTWSNKHETT